LEYANQLKAKGLDTVAAVLESGRIRLRPILMTSVSTIMGAIPVMIGVGAGSASRPAARLRDRGRHLLLHGAHLVRRARGTCC